jgi:DNA-binding NarL/FixJ family response regulator
MKDTTSVHENKKSGLHSLLEIDTAGLHALVVKIDDHHNYKTEDLLGRLTHAEAAVARAAVAGLSNREIAEERGSAARTVAVQLSSIYRKMGISSRAELAILVDGDSRE